MSELGHLHDATLRRIELDWKSGDFAAELTPSPGDTQLRIAGKGITSLSISRAFPWGPSISINKCYLHQSADGAELKIEMQSGDEIIVRGKEFHFF